MEEIVFYIIYSFIQECLLKYDILDILWRLLKLAFWLEVQCSSLGLQAGLGVEEE